MPGRPLGEVRGKLQKGGWVGLGLATALSGKWKPTNVTRLKSPESKAHLFFSRLSLEQSTPQPDGMKQMIGDAYPTSPYTT